MLPVGGGVVDSTGSDASAPLLTPFQACGVDDCSKVDGRRDPRCESESTDRQKDIINATGLPEGKQKQNTKPLGNEAFGNEALLLGSNRTDVAS